MNIFMFPFRIFRYIIYTSNEQQNCLVLHTREKFMKKQLKIFRMNMLGQFDLNFERKVKRSLLVKLVVVSKVVICKILLHDGLFFLKLGEKWPNMIVNTAKFLKYIWPFFNIIHALWWNIFKVCLTIFQHYTWKRRTTH